MYTNKEFRKKKKSIFDIFCESDSESDLDSVDEYVTNIGRRDKYYVTTPYSVTPPYEDSLISARTDYSDSGTEFRNRSELGEYKDIYDRDDQSLSGLSDLTSDVEYLIDVDSDIVLGDFSGTNSVLGRPVYDVTELFDNLDLYDCENKFVQTESTGQQTEETGAKSIAEVEEHWIEKGDELVEWDTEDQLEDTKPASPVKDINELTMSKEARFAIIDTLNDMKTKGKQENVSGGIRNKGVTAQKRLQNNRAKYNKYKTMAETKNLFIDRADSRVNVANSCRRSVSRYKSFDSEGGTAPDDYSSAFSSELNMKDDDGSSSAEDTHIPTKTKGKILPNINTRNSAKRLSSAASRFYTLERAKMTNYRIPGIGKFNIMASPENDFRITPPGFDCRYEPQPVIYKNEREQPPEDVKAKSIQKCKKWLKHVHLSPLTNLQAVQK